MKVLILSVFIFLPFTSFAQGADLDGSVSTSGQQSAPLLTPTDFSLQAPPTDGSFRLVVPIDPETYRILHGAAPDCQGRQLLTNGQCGEFQYSSDADQYRIGSSFDNYCRGMEFRFSRPEARNVVEGAVQDFSDKWQDGLERNRQRANRVTVEVDGRTETVSREYNWRDCPNLQSYNEDHGPERCRSRVRLRRGIGKPDSEIYRPLPGMRVRGATGIEWSRTFGGCSND